MVQKISDIASNGLLRRPARTLWPSECGVSRSKVLCTLLALDRDELPILDCQGWAVIQNPEFNWLKIQLKPGSEDAARRWEKAFECLGQGSDVIVVTYRFNVQLHRPICTGRNDQGLQFHYLPGPTDWTYS